MWKWDRPLGPWPSSSSYPISLEGKWDFEVVRFSVHYYYPISLEGKWDFEVVRFSVHYYYYYPIPRKGMGSCSSLVSCTLLLLYFTSSSCRSKTRLNFGLVFKISQWNFLGTLAMGPQAHILIYGLTCHAVMELWQKMCKKMDKWMYELWSPMKRWPKFTQTMILGYLG